MISIDHLLLSCLLFVCFFFFVAGRGGIVCVSDTTIHHGWCNYFLHPVW